MTTPLGTDCCTQAAASGAAPWSLMNLDLQAAPQAALQHRRKGAGCSGTQALESRKLACTACSDPADLWLQTIERKELRRTARMYVCPPHSIGSCRTSSPGHVRASVQRGISTTAPRVGWDDLHARVLRGQNTGSEPIHPPLPEASRRPSRSPSPAPSAVHQMPVLQPCWEANGQNEGSGIRR